MLSTSYNAEHTFMCRGRKKRKRSLGPFLSRRLLLAKTRTANYNFSVPISSLQGMGGIESFRQRVGGCTKRLNAGSLSPHAWGIEKFRPYLNPKRTVRHLGAVPRCSTSYVLCTIWEHSQNEPHDTLYASVVNMSPTTGHMSCLAYIWVGNP